VYAQNYYNNLTIVILMNNFTLQLGPVSFDKLRIPQSRRPRGCRLEFWSLPFDKLRASTFGRKISRGGNSKLALNDFLG
jgi:hypothetical protein